MTPVGPWPGGINNVREETALRKQELRDAVNVVLTDAGTARLRPGYEQVYAGIGVHSLWDRYFVDENGLNYLNPDYTVALLTTLSDTLSRMSYARVNDDVVYSNGTELGVIRDRYTPGPLVAPTPSAPTLSATDGALVAGTYLVAVTFVDATGQESGASVVRRLSLTDHQGIALSGIAQRTGCKTRVYATPTNSEQLRRVVDVPEGVTAWTIADRFEGFEPLRTQGLRPLPPGDIVRYYQGRLWSAKGRQVSFSEPLRYGLYNPTTGYFLLPEAVTVLEPVADGIYLVADKTYFYKGTSPEQMTQRVVSEHRATAGTGMPVHGAWFKFDPPWPEECAYWYGERGGVAAGPGGHLQPIMEGRAEDAPYAEGASFLREYDGVRQVGTALRRPGETSSFKALDSITATVRRNGVVIG